MATKWACVGPGLISTDFFTAIKENLSPDDHEFVAVASRDLSRAQKFAGEFKFKRAYGSYDEIATDEEVDVVYIGTINPSHPELSIKLLEAGKHVLCEKPMAMNKSDAKRVIETAKRTKRVFMEGIWSRFFPAYAQIRKELKDGTLGDIRLVQANFCVSIKHRESVRSPELGGGGLPYIGIYVVAFAVMVFQEMPESIQATGVMSDEKDVEFGACVLLKYKNGAIANLTYHTDAGTGNLSACIMGNKGMIEVPAPFWCPVKVNTPTGTHEFPLKEGKYNYRNSAGFQYEATAMRETILSGRLENDLCSLVDSERIHTIMDGIREKLGMCGPYSAQ